MRWLGKACFEIQLPDGKTVVLDPFVDDSVSAPISSVQFEGCDYIFLTHGHYDHILDVGKLAARFRPKIFCNDQAADSLIQRQGVAPHLITRIKVGNVIREKGLAVEVVQGVHANFAAEYKRLTGNDLLRGISDLEFVGKRALREIFETDWLPEQFKDWMVNYPQGEQLNFIFEPAGGQRVYMAGSYPDPSLIEVARRAKAHITLLQVLPGNTLQGLEEQTARMAIASGCKIVVPQHHN
jgi:L-ascorbate metabolism protein UlaG (beta-lactamase superfamily)